MSSARRFLSIAARAALRAAGDVEPNPMVGCVIARGDTILGIGHHLKFGGPHAEVNALADCARRGNEPRGATAYVTLEPCSHFGKQPPCCEALIRAGIARVVCARPDPNPVSGGGAAKLAAAGIECEFTRASTLATHLADPFAMRIEHKRPWVILKWAQTIDGRTATRTGESQWISSEASRREVHRLRARVDCVLAAIGTVLADDPCLTARGVARVRRIARRAVIDPRLELPDGCNLLRTLDAAPLTLFTTLHAAERSAPRADALRALGVEVVPVPPGPEANEHDVDLRAAVEHLAARHDATNVLVEGGAGLAGRLLAADLADELRVYGGPLVLGDEHAAPAARGIVAPRLADARRLELVRVRRLGPDVAATYRRI
ncbi:MAG: bifunctional diaminohydroxyphosphoribosylaminopyrimidine deaminase/5-amino-6-(5-phosphoribosylamino)uracil reductase RibD [Phycisphaeraceae bacterium]|nr:bifunctional diaminohydroxyphosphoribosylaminopyrimidine deaminase/5-amino-6-(5-phosphoribosylamino)uracil reductase RibD [Phycisphaeraceae bacterium]